MAIPESDEPLRSPNLSSAGAPSDRSLLRRIQQGQSDASTTLYLRYAERLLSIAAAQASPALAQRVDPEDIVQSVFRTFFRRVQLGQYSVPEGEELWKLLLVIALNKVRASGSFHRAAKRDVKRTAVGGVYDLAVESKSGRDEAALNVLRMVVEDMLQDLPEAHRKIIEMRIEGHEVNEIATVVQRSKRSVERELQEFRKRLQSALNED
jgi:RNA polymerase sigma-70 factor (ECF subfamily)